MKLYGHPLSSCTRKALIVAGEKAATIELITIDLLTGEHKQPPHLARHPFGVIPVLEHDDFQLIESRAIIRYLDAVLPGPSLVPADPRARARMDQWLSVDQAYVAPRTSALVGQCIVGPHLGRAPDPAVVEAEQRGLGRALAVIDRALADQRYLAGDALSLADVSLMPYVAATQLLRAEAVIADLRYLQRWWAEVSARPAWRDIVRTAPVL